MTPEACNTLLEDLRFFTGAQVLMSETRHYTKDTHESPISKTRRIWCEDCRVVQMQFKQSSGKWEFKHGLLQAPFI